MQCLGSCTLTVVKCTVKKMFKTEAETFLVIVKMNVSIFQLLKVGT